MKRILLALLLPAMLLILPFGIAQTPNSAEEERMLTLLKEVQTQQAQIVVNQAKIETKQADLAETIRMARTFAARVR